MTKVAMETVDAVRRRLAVEIPAGDVAAEIERAYDHLRRTAKVPGFRQGRAPRPILERLFGDQVRADVFGRLVHESYVEALREQRIDPVGQPEIITERAEPGQPLRYSATVEVKPSVVATGYSGLNVERPTRAITEADVAAFLERMRQSHARLRPLADRSEARRGDVATIDYEARVGTQVVGRGESRLVEVGGEPTELGAHLEGVAVGGEADVAIDYPPDHQNAEIAGKRVTFRVVLRAIAEHEAPVLDDHFAESHGECSTLEELRARVRRELEAAARREADAAVRAALVAQLVTAHDFAVPQAMIERRTESLVDEVLDGLGPRRPPASREDAVRVRLRDDLQPRARDQVRAELLLEAIAAQEHLQIDDAELETRVDRLAAAAGKARERVRALYEDASARAHLRSRLLQERALDLVVERAAVRVVEASSGVAGPGGNG